MLSVGQKNVTLLERSSNVYISNFQMTKRDNISKKVFYDCNSNLKICHEPGLAVHKVKNHCARGYRLGA